MFFHSPGMREADSEELIETLGSALQQKDKKRAHHAADFIAQLAAEQPVEHVQRSGYVVMKKSEGAEHSAPTGCGRSTDGWSCHWRLEVWYDHLVRAARLKLETCLNFASPMNVGNKHHYIPIFYLKQWAASNGQVCEFSKPYKIVKPRRTHPDGTGYVRGLYTFDRLRPEDADLMEKDFLLRADDGASTVLRGFLSGQHNVNDIQRSA